MYIRWKDKPRTEQKFIWHWVGNNRRFIRREQRTHAMLYCAYLVESKRIDGKPRQRSIYLASIQDRKIENTWERQLFWARVQKKLSTLNLTDEQIGMLKRKLPEHIPEVTGAQWEEYEKQCQEKIAEAYAYLASCR